MKCRKKDVGRPKINGHKNGISECVSGPNRVKENVLVNNAEKFVTRCTYTVQRVHPQHNNFFVCRVVTSFLYQVHRWIQDLPDKAWNCRKQQIPQMFRPAFLSVTNQVRKIESAWETSFRFYNGSSFPLEKYSSCLDYSIMRTNHHFISNFLINYLLFTCQKWNHFDACNGAFALSSTHNIYQYFTVKFNSLHWRIYWRSSVWISTEDIMCKSEVSFSVRLIWESNI
jgi:hypothetical protein